MKKTLDYLYIFSKLSTSFILLFLLFILGYFFYVSFKNQEVSNNDQLELINKLNQNVQKLSKLSEKIEITENSLDEIKISIQNIANSDQSKEVILLNKKIEELDLSLKNISDNLKEINTINISESNKTLSNNILSPVTNKNKKDIIRLTIYKFENNLDFTEELNILQSFKNNNNQHIFEKIDLIRLKNFRGNEFLKDIFSQELDLYLKEKFNKNSSNFISKSIMKFVVIEPSKKNTIKNNETLVLKEINTFLEEKNYKMSYKKIITIDNYETYFTETINQIQIANDFKELINKTI
ncbi:MAG: hypothetical protein HOF20_06280 [Pelagibacteraceae bacterium]|nr:hypothetical protein [Pelagibacteraceae bacterium]